MEPWICPRCGTVWAGWVEKCTCRPPTITTSGTSSNQVVYENGRLVWRQPFHTDPTKSLTEPKP
jgi:hypothetical protein